MQPCVEAKSAGGYFSDAATEDVVFYCVFCVGFLAQSAPASELIALLVFHLFHAALKTAAACSLGGDKRATALSLCCAHRACQLGVP